MALSISLVAAGCAADTRGGDDDVGSEPAAVDGPEADKPGRPMKHGRMGPPAMFRVALHELDLTDAQRTAIEAALDGLRPPERAAKAATTRSSTLSSPTRSTPPRCPSPPQKRMPFVDALVVVMPILDAEQRNGCADGILQGPPKRGKHRR